MGGRRVLGGRRQFGGRRKGKGRTGAREIVPGEVLPAGAGLTGMRAPGKEGRSVKTQISLLKTRTHLVFSKRQGARHRARHDAPTVH